MLQEAQTCARPMLLSCARDGLRRRCVLLGCCYPASSASTRLRADSAPWLSCSSIGKAPLAAPVHTRALVLFCCINPTAELLHVRAWSMADLVCCGCANIVLSLC